MYLGTWEDFFQMVFLFLGLYVIYMIFKARQPKPKPNQEKVGTPLKRPVYIYYLADHDNVPFYAGQTVDPDRRLQEHREDGSETGNPKKRYIWLMNQLGKQPTMHIITKVETTQEEANLYERHAIIQYGITNSVLP